MEEEGRQAASAWKRGKIPQMDPEMPVGLPGFLQRVKHSRVR